nr:hypothetical protein JVH1_4684 [Rhodococcus sp. JVH1]
MFEGFSDQARQVVVLAAGAARTHHQNWLAFFRSLVARGLSAVRMVPPIRTPGWWRRSVGPCQAPRGRGAEPITRRT